MTARTPTRAPDSRARTPRPVVPSRVEPRIVERRRSVQREARRRRHRLLVALGVALGLVAAAIGSTVSPLLDVDRITVVGHQRVPESDLLDASGVRHGDRLVDLDIDAARDAIMAMPWVASARVVRDWPDAVRIKVTEERPLASVLADDASVLVSTTGRVLERLDAPAPGHPTLEVDGALELRDDEPAPSDLVGAIVGEPLLHAVTVFERIPEDLRGALSVARMATDGSIEFDLEDGAVVRFGQPEDVAAKLLAVESVLSQVVLDCLATLDVREPNPAAVSRGPGCPGISPGTESSSTDSSTTDSSTTGTGRTPTNTANDPVDDATNSGGDG